MSKAYRSLLRSWDNLDSLFQVLSSVAWLPADVTIIPQIEAVLTR